MIAIKNSSDKRLSYSFDGVDYFFNPQELRLLPEAVVNHLLKASHTCAVGGSPLKLVPSKDVKDELRASPACSPELKVIRNVSDKAVELVYNSVGVMIAPGAEVVLPRGEAEHHMSQQSRSKGNALELRDVPSKSEPAPAAGEEPQSAPASASADNPADAPAEEEEAGKNANKNKRRK